MAEEKRQDEAASPGKLSTGPLRDHPAMQTFGGLSERAFALYHRIITPDLMSTIPVRQHIYVRHMCVAQQISLAIRSLAGWNLLHPALALGRIRLEQAIVCSYLLHENEREGLGPFVMHMPISTFRRARAAVEHPDLEPNLPKIDLEAMRKEAEKAQAKIGRGSTPGEPFQRAWTKLDLQSLCRRRDALACQPDAFWGAKLEVLYIAFYREWSSIVHSDCNSLTFTYLDLFPGTEEGLMVLMSQPRWIELLLPFVAQLDILQSYEAAKYLSSSADLSEFSALRDAWKARRDSTIG